MARVYYIGDEATAAGYRLAGAEVRVPGASEVVEAFRRVRDSEADMILLSAELAGALPPGVPGDEIYVKDEEIFVNNMPYPVTEEPDRTILNDLHYPSVDKFFTHDDLLLFKEKIIDPVTRELSVEHYMMKHIYFKQSMLSNPGKIFVVPEKSYMVMGDNRDDSDDSRHWGFVGRKGHTRQGVHDLLFCELG